MQTAGILLFGYLLGSVPTGFILGSRAGVDVRRAGSGNIGATNVVRLMGWKAGMLTFLADAAKGMIPVLVAASFDFDPAVQVQTALASFIGHLYPVFLRFRGGKGVATALGIFAALVPWVAVALIVVFAAVAVSTRWVSLASLSAAVAAPALVWFLAYSTPVFSASLIITGLTVLRHRKNIQRLLSGTESRFNLRSF